MSKKISRALTSAAMGLVLAGAGWAQSQSPIVLQVTPTSGGLNGCSTAAGSNTVAVISWSFGVQNPVSTNVQAGAGKAKFNDFVVAKAFDECSPALFEYSAKGIHLRTATLTQVDKNGHPLMTIILSNPIITQYLLTDGSSNAGPVESIAFSYDAIQISNANNRVSTCWDLKKEGAGCSLHP
jgi:type VI protein secretion system component Hcp